MKSIEVYFNIFFKVFAKINFQSKHKEKLLLSHLYLYIINYSINSSLLFIINNFIILATTFFQYIFIKLLAKKKVNRFRKKLYFVIKLFLISKV